MSEIYCSTGKINVDLPIDAWTQDIEIPPCKGCQHPHHIKKVKFIDGELNAAQYLPITAETKNVHSVSVIKTLTKGEVREVVYCTCDCDVRVKRKE